MRGSEGKGKLDDEDGNGAFTSGLFFVGDIGELLYERVGHVDVLVGEDLHKRASISIKSPRLPP